MAQPSRLALSARDLDVLVRLSAQGDVAAFAQLYDAVAPRVVGLVRRIVRDPSQSEEVAQEVLLEIWQKAGTFDASRGSAATWVLTLAHRRAVDRVRSVESSRRRDAADAAMHVITVFDETADTAHASAEAERVRAAMSRLPGPQLRALDLAYFGGYTHSEIAVLTQVPLGTAKTRIRNGLLRLRALLAVPTHEIA